MKTIIVRDILTSTALNEDGEVLFNHIRASFDKGEKVTVSFEGIAALNTSFVNSAFADLLDYYSFSFIKEYLVIINSTKGINRLIGKRMKEENESKVSGMTK